MEGAGRGRGRGSAILESINKKRLEEASSSSSGSPAPSEVSSPLPPIMEQVIKGRGRTLLDKVMQRPGDVIVAPASDCAPTMPVPRGAGRGSLLLKSLGIGSSAASTVSVGPSDIDRLTDQMAGSTVSASTAATGSTLKPKNKYYSEIKDTPPVVKKGSYGREVKLSANYIRLSVEPGMDVYEYEVRYEPPVDYRGLCVKLLNMHKDVLGPTRTFDGTTLLMPKNLGQEVTVLKSIHPNDGSTVNVKVIFRRTRKMGEVIQLYNILFNNIMKILQLVQFKRENFDPSAAIPIPQHKLQVWPGYVTAVNEYEGGLMLTLDSTHRVLRTESVLEFMNMALQKDRAGFKKNMEESLLTQSVMTDYNKKLFRVDDIAWDLNPLNTFEKDGCQINYVDYYKKQYNIHIMDYKQPLLICKQTRNFKDKDGEKRVDYQIHLVPEICLLTGLTDEMRSNFRLMKDVATYTRITPNQRYYAFRKFLENVHNNERASKLLSDWGLRIHPDTVKLIGRQLPPEPIFFGNGVTTKGSPNADWGRDATNNNCLDAKDLLNWIIVYTRRDANCTKDFVDTLLRCGPPMGMRINPPKMIMLQADSNQQYIQSIQEACQKQEGLQLIVAIMTSQRDDRYSAIKTICNVKQAMPSQVIVARTIMNREKIRAIVQKITLQINCKLGGTLWSVQIPAKSAMIVGIDTYHEKGGRYKSVCGFVASYDESMTRWYSRVVFQQPSEEISNGIKSCLVDALLFFNSQRGYFPEKIIIYRDGVGDGQLNHVRDLEIADMKSVFCTVLPNYNPKLIFIVVQKRINTRMFLMSGNQFENPAPGTVLDYDITRRDWYDFLIVSQKVGQGTVTPSHYIVLEDGSNASPDMIQRLTFKLCHLYYNWPGTVRVPAPCQYAHKLAYLVGEHMKQAHDVKLADKLFFL